MSEWGSRYSTGAIVLTLRDGKLQFVVCIQHTGDYHHRYAIIDVVRLTENGNNRPTGIDRITATGELFSGYEIGPQVGMISIDDIISLAQGVETNSLHTPQIITAVADLLNKTASHSRK
ncbi:MAG: hypothetical protein WBP12_02355 [Candidatus Saccharimonas sp.]